MLIRITDAIFLDDAEVLCTAIRAQGPGGQHVNKASTAVHLRFDIAASSLPEPIKSRMLQQRDRRISGDGIVTIKAQRHRSLEKNRAEALERLCDIIRKASATPKTRKATKPTRSSQKRRLESKLRHGETKALRRKPVL
jgi:ribosome-associated protein